MLQCMYVYTYMPVGTCTCTCMSVNYKQPLSRLPKIYISVHQQLRVPIFMTQDNHKCFELVCILIGVALEQELSCIVVLCTQFLNFWKPPWRLIIIRQTDMYIHVHTYMYMHCSSGDASSYPSPSLSPPPPLRN